MVAVVATRDEAVRERDKLSASLGTHQATLRNVETLEAELVAARAAVEKANADVQAAGEERDVSLANVAYFTRQLKEHEQMVSQTEQLLASELDAEREKTLAQAGAWSRCTIRTLRLCVILVLVFVRVRVPSPAEVLELKRLLGTAVTQSEQLQRKLAQADSDATAAATVWAAPCQSVVVLSVNVVPACVCVQAGDSPTAGSPGVPVQIQNHGGRVP